ncbi:hypothetical protein KFE25_003988 [Diacronema lutheri]|uniref:Uncharacterized protein n=2 Tax=Diacronema lutheri TaxID=2081491 RepID=A0A8J6CBH8_DIALT|nr:hypothetical protein KFE25_003988 [Diacronema lutheri]
MVASDDDAWTSGALIRLVEIVSMATGACKTWDEDESEVVKDNLPSVREAWALILQGGSAAGRGQRAAVDQKLLTPEEKWKPIRELLGNPNFKPGVRTTYAAAIGTSDADVNAAHNTNSLKIQAAFATLRSNVSTLKTNYTKSGNNDSEEMLNQQLNQATPLYHKPVLYLWLLIQAEIVPTDFYHALAKSVDGNAACEFGIGVYDAVEIPSGPKKRKKDTSAAPLAAQMADFTRTFADVGRRMAAALSSLAEPSAQRARAPNARHVEQIVADELDENLRQAALASSALSNAIKNYVDSKASGIFNDADLEVFAAGVKTKQKEVTQLSLAREVLLSRQRAAGAERGRGRGA